MLSMQCVRYCRRLFEEATMAVPVAGWWIDKEEKQDQDCFKSSCDTQIDLFSTVFVVLIAVSVWYSTVRKKHLNSALHHLQRTGIKIIKKKINNDSWLTFSGMVRT